MSLPLQAIDRIFARLGAAYGRQFLDLYADIDPADVKTAWCHELSAFGSQAALRRIAWALDNLPDRAPNAPQFRQLCMQAKLPEPPPLPMPPANPERMRAELEKLGHVEKTKRMSANTRFDHKAWAKSLIARDSAGERVRPISLRFAKEALRMHLNVGVQ
jgi:hypothetical protein